MEYAASAGNALQGFGSIQSGYAQAAGYRAEARKAKQDAQAGRIAAVQTDTFLREELASVQANIDVMRSAAGVSALSPTGMAYKEEQDERASLERRIRMGNAENAELALDNAAQWKRFAATSAIYSGWYQGIGSFAKAANAFPTG